MSTHFSGALAALMLITGPVLAETTTPHSALPNSPDPVLPVLRSRRGGSQGEPRRHVAGLRHLAKHYGRPARRDANQTCETWLELKDALMSSGDPSCSGRKPSSPRAWAVD